LKIETTPDFQLRSHSEGSAFFAIVLADLLPSWRAERIMDDDTGRKSLAERISQRISISDVSNSFT
jgi:hypothetical protein